MKAIFCAGDSHITAIRDGYRVRVREGRTHGFEAWKEVRNAQFRDGREYVISAEYDAELAGIISDVDVSAIFVCFGGGEHSFLALVNQRPFALYTPDDTPDDVPPEKTVGSGEVIPFELMRATCASYVERTVPFVRHVKGLTNLPMYHILPPPPTASDDYHGRYPNDYFRELVERFGIVPASLRRKVWHICNTVARRMYEGLGISVIEPPMQALDERGYLDLRYRGSDMVHGNAEYGALVFDRLMSIAESHEIRKAG
jgi:hypothetical protein